MSKFTETDSGLIIVKDIDYSVPQSDKVDSRTFSRLLDDDKVVASYKMYWLLGILDEVSTGKTEIEFKRIISRMIVYSWYPILQYRLSFGFSDNLKKPVNYVAEKYDFKANSDERELLDFLYKSDDKELNKMMKDLTVNVPYRLLSPFFSPVLRGKPDYLKERLITELSLIHKNCMYKIIKGEVDKIVLNDGWADYLKDNYKIIKSWISYKLVLFIQKRNPNVPAVAFKLEAPKVRNLTKAIELWNGVIGEKGIRDIYTNKEFSDINFREHGVLSIDHFIPWSFVLHDEMWNLVPTFKNINAKKSNNLLPFDRYIDDFCEIQYKAFSYICEKRKERVLEEYMNVIAIDNPYDYYEHGDRMEFCYKIKRCISPLYQIAVNQGFQVIEGI